MRARQVSDSNCIRQGPDGDKVNELRKNAMANDHLVALAAFMSVMGTETRQRILYVLWLAGELCVCDLADLFEITQPAMSRHLRVLREKALVGARRDAQTVYYSVCTDNPFAKLLVSLFEAQEADRITLNVGGDQ